MFRLTSDLNRHLEQGGTVVVPTHERLRAVQLAYAAMQLAGGRSVWPSPQVLTPTLWARREWERYAAEEPRVPRLLPPAEEWLLWRGASGDAARGHVFLDHGALAEALQRASALAAAFHVTAADSAAMNSALQGGAAGLLRAAQRLFEARCRELHCISVAASLTRLPPGGRRAPLLHGFIPIPPALAAHADRSTDAARVDAVEQVPSDGRQVLAADAQAEQEAIAAWCHGKLRERADARLLVLLPGAAGARERLAALIRGVLDPQRALQPQASQGLVGLEGGQRFVQLPLAAHALLGLEILGGGELELEPVAEWLGAPFWERPPAPQRAALASRLRASGPASLDLRRLRGALQLAPPELEPAARELDALLRRALQALEEGSASPKVWSERFEAALAALTWPGATVNAAAVHESRIRLRELLDEFGALAPSAGALTRAAALELLSALAQRAELHAADQDVAVLISGALCDPVVRYDGIWAAGLTSEAFPQPVMADPFLPRAAQVAAGLPQASGAGRWSEALSLLRALSAATDDLVLSSPTREEDLTVLPSPLLTRTSSAPRSDLSLWLPARLHRAGLVESLEDACGPRWNPLRPLPSGTRALTLQSICPFRAYAELRLGAAPPESAVPGIAMDQRGRLLHVALQALWARLHDSQALARLEEVSLTRLIGECVDLAAQSLTAEPRARRRSRGAEGQYDLFAARSPALDRECRRAAGLIRRLCELERARPAFTVEAVEQGIELALGGGRVQMRLDRIDRITEGRVVLDYKSGRPGHPDWYGERPTHPQLLAYAAALGSEVIGLATVNVTAHEVRFSGVAAGADLLPQVRALPAAEAGPEDNWRAQLLKWQMLIAGLIRDFLSGVARVDPAPGACDYCHVRDLCRIGAQREDPAEVPADALLEDGNE